MTPARSVQNPKSKIQNNDRCLLPPTGQQANRLNGQSIIETAILLAVVGAALVVFFSFIRSAVSTRVKIGADTFGHGLLHNGN